MCELARSGTDPTTYHCAPGCHIVAAVCAPDMTDDSAEDDAVYVGEYDPDESISVSVANALADLLDVDPTSISLYENVDTEALDRLFAPTRTGVLREGRVAFETEGYLVTVRSDGTFTIAPADE